MKGGWLNVHGGWRCFSFIIEYASRSNVSMNNMVVYLGSIMVAATNFYLPNNTLYGHGFSWSFSGNFSCHIRDNSRICMKMDGWSTALRIRLSSVAYLSIAL
ncbi:hypothetical protein SLEP1_g5014 [Rubroshorea leprosula]|uniref:Uncharacterized protein n=1 Tax=Rubroshorea leprosula TaxID=152421 RepID=A0AAV5HZH2_9ROSI|nr:hypothetical protein SLEP1_g5014 [Rubroshorea leprosula]